MMLVKRLYFRTGIYIFLLVSISNVSFALQPSDLKEVKGYTIVDVTNVNDEFEGADYNKKVELDNGMVFEFNNYSYSYAYRPIVVVFSQHYSLNEVKRFVPGATSAITSYKLLIDDRFYNVYRIR